MSLRIAIAAGAAIVIAALVAGAHHARAGQDRFDAATALLAAERHAEAAEALLELSDALPDHPRAADALFSAARLFEERLGDPARAADLYEQLIVRYPDDRTALAAARRAEILRRDMGAGDEGAAALARFNDILQGVPERGDAASIAAMESLLAEHPDWEGAPRALAWLGSAHARIGDHAAAADRLDEILRRWPDGEHAFAARRAAGDLAVTRGRFAEAEGHYRALDPGGDPARAHLVDDAFRHLARERLRARLYLASLAALVLALATLLLSLRLGAGGWRAAAAAARRPPLEVVYLLPVALLVSGAALVRFQDVAPAVASICAGGVLITWLSGAGLACRRSRARAALHALASAAAVAALCYVALHRTHLWDLVATTVLHGPEH